jgi:hypothetical protein
MPVISSYHWLSSFTCSPHEHSTMNLLLSRHRSGVATKPCRGVNVRMGKAKNVGSESKSDE